METNFTGYIYLCRNKVNNKIYIGQTINFEKRVKKHLTDAKAGRVGTYFHSALNCYGEHNFDWETVETIVDSEYSKLKETLCEKEIYYIQLYNSNISGYNLTKGGENPPIISELPNSKEIYARIAKKTSKRMLGAGNVMYGKTLTNEHKQKIGQALKGHKHSTETRELLSKMVRGKTWEERYGKETSDRMKKLKSISAKNQKNRVSRSKLTTEDVIFIRDSYGKYLQRELASMFNVSTSYISEIVNFKKRNNI